MRSSAGCGTDGCGRTSATSQPSTMPSPPSTRPSGSRGRRSSAFVREDSETRSSGGRSAQPGWHSLSKRGFALLESTALCREIADRLPVLFLAIGFQLSNDRCDGPSDRSAEVKAKGVALLRRFIVVALTVLTLGGVFAGSASAATDGATPPVYPSGDVFARAANNGPVHEVWTRSISAAECKGVRKVNPGATCSISVTLDVRRVNGPQRPPAGAHVAASAQPAVASANYWTYEVVSQTARGPPYWARLREEVKYHDNCRNANCPNQDIVWNQWLDDSGFACGPGCTISERADGVIGNGTQHFGSWENFTVNCDISITGNSAGCNAGHGNRL